MKTMARFLAALVLFSTFVWSSSSPSSPPSSALELTTREELESAGKEHAYLFVNFCVPWSVWCQRLASVWEDFALRVKSDNLPVVVATQHTDANGDYLFPDVPAGEYEVVVTDVAASVAVGRSVRSRSVKVIEPDSLTVPPSVMVPSTLVGTNSTMPPR